jgi:hypothetical protein
VCVCVSEESWQKSSRNNNGGGGGGRTLFGDGASE